MVLNQLLGTVCDSVIGKFNNTKDIIAAINTIVSNFAISKTWT